MNTMNGRMVTMRKDGLPYEEMGYVPPPNRLEFDPKQIVFLTFQL